LEKLFEKFNKRIMPRIMSVVSGKTQLPGCATRRRRQDLVQYFAWTWNLISGERFLRTRLLSVVMGLASLTQAAFTSQLALVPI
jgi:hypothetical protein